MEITAILKKVTNKETLTDEELEFLGKFDPNDASRIPKERLDKEIEKRKAAEKNAGDLSAKIEELKSKLEELENKDLDEAEKAKLASKKEIEKLQKQVEDLKKAGDEATAKAAALERNAKIRDLATSRKFKDAEYLDFRMKSQNIDLEDEDAVGKFFGELEKSAPHLFDSSAKPGTGTGGDNQGGGTDGNAVNLKRLEELRAKPEFTRAEAAEYLKLSKEATAAEDAANNK
jgi:hypothetical protein